MPVKDIKAQVLQAAFDADSNKNEVKVLFQVVNGEPYLDVWALVGGAIQQIRVKVSDILTQTELDVILRVRLRCYAALMAEKAPGSIPGL